jgi:hypothetical protein
LGREELGNLFSSSFRNVDPFHTDLLSAPLRWLLERKDSDAYRIECVGFGINLLSGNYEFACLVVIDDEEWWGRFGGQLQANWEVGRIRLCSSRDTASLRDLMRDPSGATKGCSRSARGCAVSPSSTPGKRVAAPFIDVEA